MVCRKHLLTHPHHFTSSWFWRLLTSCRVMHASSPGSPNKSKDIRGHFATLFGKGSLFFLLKTTLPRISASWTGMLGVFGILLKAIWARRCSVFCWAPLIWLFISRKRSSFSHCWIIRMSNRCTTQSKRNEMNSLLWTEKLYRKSLTYIHLLTVQSYDGIEKILRDLSFSHLQVLQHPPGYIIKSWIPHNRFIFMRVKELYATKFRFNVCRSGHIQSENKIILKF